MPRDRACAAVIRDERVLMVRLRRPDGSEYWTLPGGGVEPGETREEAALRELAEEANVRGTLVRHLYDSEYGLGTSSCFLVEVDPEAVATLGRDDDDPNDLLIDIAWRPLAEVRDDPQVSRVLAALS